MNSTTQQIFDLTLEQLIDRIVGQGTGGGLEGAKAELMHRQILAQQEAARAQQDAARYTKDAARWMFWAVIVAAVTAIINIGTAIWLR
jgi:hypothetical protein